MPANDAPPATAFAYELPVRYGDTDQMGVAYYANYLYWFEIARTEWLRAPRQELQGARGRGRDPAGH
jgi:acyl-CoA thioester hydrolase